jgi:hypothetical protein
LERTQTPTDETLLKKTPALLIPALLVFLFVSFPGAYHAARPGLDPSWHYAINSLPQSGLMYGQDVAFTYGPLGFLLYPLDIGPNMLITLGFRLFIHLMFAWAVLYYAFRVSGVVPAILFLLAYSFALLMKLPAESTLAILIGLLAGISAQGTKAARITVPLTAALAGLCLFIKPNLALAALSMVILAEVVRLTKGRARLYSSPLLIGGAYLLVAIPLWYRYFGTLEHFGVWLRATYEFARYNSVAVSLDGPRSVLIIALGILWLYVLVVSILKVMKSSAFSMAFLFLPAVLLSFKHGFDRQDGHVLFFFVFLLAVTALLILASTKIRELGLTVFFFLAVLLVTIPVAVLHNGIYYADAVDFVSGRTGWSNVRSLAHLDETRASLRAQAGENLAPLELPQEWLTLIQANQGSVDVIPWEISFCPANELEWRPSPTIQTYVTYTAWLDAWNAKHFSGVRAPDFILLEWKNIDERHIPFDVPATWRALLVNYQLVDAKLDRNLLLLGRNQFPAELRQGLIGTRTASTTSWIDVPQARGPVFARFNPKFTTEGLLAKTLFRIPPITIELAYENGQSVTHRMIPDTARNGLLISHVPIDAADAALVFSGGAVDRVVRFRIGGPGAAYLRDTLDVEFLNAPAGVEKIRQLALGDPCQPPLPQGFSVQ